MLSHSSSSFTLSSLIVLVLVHESTAANWGYDVGNGPDTDRWSPMCHTGRHQTPIDIHSKDIDFERMDDVRFVGYNQAQDVNATNNGHTVSASGFAEWDSQPYIIGGGLDGKYNLLQFHLHWGQKDSEGSEHMIGGLSYAAELHLVHIKEGLGLKEALERPDGLAVVGVFLNANKNYGEPLSAFTNALDQLTESGDEIEIKKMRPESLLPELKDSFYRYEGSLTTPSCQEAVQWILLSEPVSISYSQLEMLRAVQNTDGKVHQKNYRPPQPINGRRIRYRPANIQKYIECSSSHISILFSLIVAFMAKLL